MTIAAVESARASRTRYEIVDGLSFNEWKGLGEQLLRMGDSSQWWIGDWLVYGERYRRQYREAMEQLDRAYGTLRNLAYVASRVPPENRVPELSWSCHRAVTTLPVDEQRHWLDHALRQGLTTRELEQAIAETKTETSTRTPALTLRAVGELRELCTRAAEVEGMPAAEWAATVLERAARLVLDDVDAIPPESGGA